MIFMMTEKHVDESVSSGLISSDRCMYMKWGEDSDYIDSIPILEKNDKFTFISTGKAHGDFDTLCSVFLGIDNAILKIYTSETWGGQNYREILDKYNNPNIQVVYSHQIQNGKYSTILDYLFAQMKAADCAVIICKDVNFGVGYTNILDSRSHLSQ